MEIEETTTSADLNPPLAPLTFNEEIKDYLIEGAKWARFLAIVGFVILGIMVIASIFMMIGISIFSKIAGSGIMAIVAGFFYLLFALLYYFPVSYLYKFATLVREGLESDSEMDLTESFKNLKSLFKFTGILTIIVLSFYVLALLLTIPAMMLIK